VLRLDLVPSSLQESHGKTFQTGFVGSASELRESSVLHWTYHQPSLIRLVIFKKESIAIIESRRKHQVTSGRGICLSVATRKSSAAHEAKLDSTNHKILGNAEVKAYQGLGLQTLSRAI